MIRKTLKLATVLGALAGAFSFGYITGVNDEASNLESDRAQF